MNPLVIGMNNPYGADPYYALYPLPRESAGGRLYAMVREATHLTPSQYVSLFDRMNLVEGPWSYSRAQLAIPGIIQSLAGRQVVLLGKDVQRAFGIQSDPLTVHRRLVRLLPRSEATFYLLPHTSGRNPWYNDPDHRQAAVQLLAQIHEEREDHARAQANH